MEHERYQQNMLFKAYSQQNIRNSSQTEWNLKSSTLIVRRTKRQKKDMLEKDSKKLHFYYEICIESIAENAIKIIQKWEILLANTHF